MKITVWIRPDERGTPTIQRYGRKLANAIEGTADNCPVRGDESPRPPARSEVAPQ